MTQDMSGNVEPELQHAADALKAARALLAIALPNEAAGRLYYSVFHAARAALFSIGIAPKSHEAVRSLLAQHFVRPGRLPTQCSKDLAQLEGLRNAGDYDPQFAMSVEDLEPELARAERFLGDVRKALSAP